ncbi:MAG: hypothetical protein HYV26_21595 [Candidatus Hydrogenedentes bacterium]|nr:hypothetical protein [Candidatus Hydrogenedentota bacterium]MBI3119568.1 hypothetical protein [Candidatus Hydrogenedentota bacterium]
MADAIEKAISDLANTKAGWVTRRDAAEALGGAARRALVALQRHAQDADVDVRATVTKELARIGAPAPAPEPAPQTYSLKELAESCAREGARSVEAAGDAYVVTVQVEGKRTQKVHIALVQRPDGKQLVRVFTRCGEAKPDLFPWLLQSNAKLNNCAFAVVEEQGREAVLLLDNFPRDRATPQMVKSAVKEIAQYGDWLERKISGEDQF